MAKTQKLLLPYAYDSTGELVHISNAHKGETYTCPECGEILSLRISKIPEGQKNHRRNHFSHPKGSPDNQCTESFLHKLFKERAAECIRKKISNKETEFRFVWSCHECGERHQGNLLKKAKSVCLEYDLGVCRPDIALLDANGKVVIVIEVVVTHAPTGEAMTYYDSNKMACLQYMVSDFEECEDIANRLAKPDRVNWCLAPKCEVCGHYLQKDKISILTTSCWKCNKEMSLAIKFTDYGMLVTPKDFTEKEVELANKHGANIQKRYSQTTESHYYANVCPNCHSFIGENYIIDYIYEPSKKEIETDYFCHHCKELEEQKKYEEMRAKSKKLDELNQRAMEKECPRCGMHLVLRNGKKGYFFGCRNYPNCRYTENITLEDASNK